MSLPSVETDAPRDVCESIARDLFARHVTAAQSGRLGLEFTLADAGQAYDLAAAIRRRGYEAWVEADVRSALTDFRTAREGMRSTVLLAKEEGLSQTEIAALSGLSRQWIAKIIQNGSPS